MSDRDLPLTRPKLPKRPAEPQLATLDAAVTKVGQDFPAVDALLRQGWTGAA